VQNATQLKKKKLKIANIFQTRKSLFMPEGSIAKRQTQTPMAQYMLMSFEERLLIILIISGIFQRGNTIEATRAILSIIICSGLAGTAQYVLVFMLIHLDQLCPGRAQIFSRIELLG